MSRGSYIVIEGGEGCGKTTQAELLHNYLKEKNIACYLGREPGGIKAAEEMRKILKHNKEDISPIGELFGFEFARTEFFDKIIIPKLDTGINVISDRSGYSTIAYQGYGGGIDLDCIKLMNNISMKGIKPDITFIIDIDPGLGLEKEVVKDRFSEKGLEYHKRVRQGFLDIAKPNSKRCVIIQYQEGNPDKMQNEIRQHIKTRLKI